MYWTLCKMGQLHVNPHYFGKGWLNAHFSTYRWPCRIYVHVYTLSLFPLHLNLCTANAKCKHICAGLSPTHRKYSWIDELFSARLVYDFKWYEYFMPLFKKWMSPYNSILPHIGQGFQSAGQCYCIGTSNDPLLVPGCFTITAHAWLTPCLSLESAVGGLVL